MPATQTVPAAARFTFAPGTIVHVLGPYKMDLDARGVDQWTGRIMEVVKHYEGGDVLLIDESGNPRSEVWIRETRLIAD